MGIASEKEAARLLQNISGTLLSALNGAMAASDVLSRKLERSDTAEGDQERQELLSYLAMLRHDQHRMLRVAENMRELAAINLGEAELAQDAFDLNILCGELTETISTLVEGIQIRFIPCKENCTALGDIARLERLILNLLANSLRRCTTGDTVELRTAREGDMDMLLLVVENNGSCVPSEALPTLFADYARETDMRDAYRGAGLGLSVAEGIARLHGGSLLICTEGQKTKAIFSMPYRWDNQLRVPTGTYGRRIRSIVTALSDVLDYQKFAPPFL